jgi:hypothetical protein
MAQSSDPIEVYLEIGQKRTFAGALAWPGWCRAGRDAAAALQALYEAGPRYAAVLTGTPLTFRSPADASALTVVERLDGTATTDFGAPDVAPSDDARPLTDADLARSQAILQACWRAFDAAAGAADGKDLRKGPRGGGREVEGIIRHVQGADAGYLSRLAWKLEPPEGADGAAELARTREAIVQALAAAARGEVAPRGPRGGVRWSPRYFVRRVAWHVLDHTWEIEDRLE